ncbi:MAG: SDR family NAD(P)-dependent oxidoreductase, partial [Pseudomonadota bacterium]
MKNRTILVTGGNRGIGKAIVEGLAINKSNTILLGCRNLDEGQKLALDIGDNVNAIAMDLSSKKTLDFDIKALLKDHPSIDVLINNAGILREGDLSNCSIDDV